MKLSEVYKKLIEDSSSLFLQTKEGELVEITQFPSRTEPLTGISSLHVYCGSFNSLHIGHKDIYKYMENWANQNGYTEAVYETSINRWEKPELSIEDLENRLAQFVDYAPILITNVARFIDKAGLFRKHFHHIRFHIGIDTFTRMVEHDYGVLGLSGIHADFIVHERIVDGEKKSLKTIYPNQEICPVNCTPAKYNRTLESLSISSTTIRNEVKKLNDE